MSPLIPTVDAPEPRAARAHGLKPRLIGVMRGKNFFYPAQGLPTTGTPGANVLSLAPLDIDRRCLLTGLAGDVTTAGSAGALLRLTLYTDDGSGCFPGALVLDAGTIDATVTGPVTLAPANPIMLEPGRYWIGGAVQGGATTAPVVRTINNNGAITMPLTTNAVTNFNLGAAMNGVTGAAPAAYTESVGYTITVPRVAARLT